LCIPTSKRKKALETAIRSIMILGMEPRGRTCFKCGKNLVGLGGMAMHMPEMGTMEWCLECTPRLSLDEALEMIERLKNPPKEPGKRSVK